MCVFVYVFRYKIIQHLWFYYLFFKNEVYYDSFSKSIVLSLTLIFNGCMTRYG